MAYKNADRRRLRHLRVRKNLSGTALIPRMSVFRSNRSIYVQIVSDDDKKTLASCGSNNKEILDYSSEIPKDYSAKCLNAYKVGKVIADKCKKIDIVQVVFDRGGYKYHGRVKALANGARDNGMVF